MEQLRVTKGIEIGVNDDGDTIFLDVENTLFINRYYHLLERVDKIIGSIDTKKEIKDAEFGDYVTDIMKQFVAELDECFGVDSCKKIFGEGVVPSPSALIDLFDQLTPIVDKYIKKREAKVVQKYQPRTGGKK